MLLNLKNTAIASVAALSIALGAAAPAQALGRNERNFLKGVAATLIIGAIINEGRAHPQPQPQPQPQPPHQHRPRYDNDGYDRYDRYDDRRPTGHVIGSNSSVYSTHAARAFNSYTAADRRAIQRKLRAYGYYSGSVDGAFGPATYRAVLAYARDTSGERQLTTAAGSYGVYDGLLS